MLNNYICFKDVYKKFGNNKVLKGLNFSVEQGKILALLGHNGAGKTTTLRILLGLLEAESGDVKVFGRKVDTNDESIRREAGVLSEDIGLYESLTVYDNLKLFADIYGLDKYTFENRMNYLLEKFDILDCKYKVINKFSLGTKKKVAIIRTLLHNPKLVLMDEPVNALDPISIRVLHELMRDMKEQNGTTFIITTHNLDEVIKICDALVIIKGGRSVWEGNIEVNSNISFLETHIKIYNIDEEQTKTNIEKIMSQKFKIEKWRFEGNILILPYHDEQIIAMLIKEFSDNKIYICEVQRNNFNLEQLYVDINTEGLENV